MIYLDQQEVSTWQNMLAEQSVQYIHTVQYFSSCSEEHPIDTNLGTGYNVIIIHGAKASLRNVLVVMHVTQYLSCCNEYSVRCN
jgi:hypothetical protein